MAEFAKLLPACDIYIYVHYTTGGLIRCWVGIGQSVRLDIVVVIIVGLIVDDDRDDANDVVNRNSVLSRGTAE